MNKSYLKRLIFRLFALMFAFGVVYSVQNPALASGVLDATVAGAVRPQQGWYVRDTMTSSVSGTSREYFIIDTKMTDDPWYIEMRSTVLLYDTPFFEFKDYTDTTLGMYTQFYPLTYYRGFSQIDWVLDSDWLILFEWDGISLDNTSFYNFAFWNASNVFSFMNSNTSDISTSSVSSFYSSVPFLPGVPFAGPGSKTVRLTTGYTGFSGSVTSNSKLDLLDSRRFGVCNPFMAAYDTSVSGSPISDWYAGGVSINDFCFCIFPYGVKRTSDIVDQASVYGRVALSFAIPVDKAPAGTQVGDSWPKVQPLPVQIEGALDDYKAWKDNALAQTPFDDPADGNFSDRGLQPGNWMPLISGVLSNLMLGMR